MSGFWTPQAFREAMGGRWLLKPDDSEAVEIRGVSSDSRTIGRGEAFFAVRGQRFDGHRFADDAVERGARLVVVDDAIALAQGRRGDEHRTPVLEVRDSVAALGQLARAYRESELARVPLITVCGSNGKTTTVRMLECVLGSALRGSASPKSYNNEIGLPLTMLRARPEDQYLVCEAGCNAPGEIANLGAIAQPDLAVITSVGRAHMEQFESIDEVAREDASMFRYLRPGGRAIIPSGEDVLDEQSKPVPHVTRFGAAAGADLRLSRVRHVRDDEGRARLVGEVEGGPILELPLIGEHNALNALAALAVARRMGMSDDEVARALREVDPAELRLAQTKIGDIELIVDCYNANPESMRCALETFAQLTDDPARRVLILGDMLELGEIGPSAHREIGRMILDRCEARVLVTVGSLATHIAEVVAKERPKTSFIMHADLSVSDVDELVGQLRSTDQVLIKGSRGMRLERIVLALERRLMREKKLDAA